MTESLANPNLSFLNRGAQLIRLARIVIADVQNRILNDGLPVRGIDDILARSNAGTLVTDLEAFFAQSRESVSDAEVIIQLFFTRTVDAFRIFMEEIVGAILRERPNLLPKPPGELEDVMEDLGSQSFPEFVKTVSRSYGLVFFPEGRDFTHISLVFALRNLITHQYGIVTRRFLSRYPHPNLVAGQSYPFTPQLIEEKNNFLLEMSKAITSRVSKQFSVRFGRAGMTG